MNMNDTQKKLNERLQPVYAQFLEDFGIKYGDIAPDLSFEFDDAEMRLATLIDRWIYSLKGDMKAYRVTVEVNVMGNNPDEATQEALGIINDGLAKPSIKEI